MDTKREKQAKTALELAVKKKVPEEGQNKTQCVQHIYILLIFSIILYRTSQHNQLKYF